MVAMMVKTGDVMGNGCGGDQQGEPEQSNVAQGGVCQAVFTAFFELMADDGLKGKIANAGQEAGCSQNDAALPECSGRFFIGFLRMIHDPVLLELSGRLPVGEDMSGGVLLQIYLEIPRANRLAVGLLLQHVEDRMRMI